MKKQYDPDKEKDAVTRIKRTTTIEYIVYVSNVER